MSSSARSLKLAAERLHTAKRPLLLVGPEGGPAAGAIVQLAERLGAAILTTPDAISVIDHRQSSGTFSFGASPFARAVAARADLVLAISSLGEFTCRLGEAFRGHALIQLAERYTDVARNSQPIATVVGPIAESVTKLLQLLPTQVVDSPQPWFAPLGERDSTPRSFVAKPGSIHPIAAIAAIQAALPESVRVCLDITSGALHAYEHLKLSTSQRTFSSVENSACMGEALMASLGIRLASQLPTLALVGDWGYCMTPAEIHTAVELELGQYVVLIWANGGGAFIGAGIEQQRIRVPDAVWRWQTPPDFAQVATAYRARGVTVTDAAALTSELSRALCDSSPVVIEARIDPTARVPAGDRFLTLGDARA